MARHHRSSRHHRPAKYWDDQDLLLPRPRVGIDRAFQWNHWHGLNGDGDGWRGALGVEKKITTNIWLVLSAGEQFGEAGAKTNNLFAVSSLRFGTADNAQFAPQ